MNDLPPNPYINPEPPSTTTTERRTINGTLIAETTETITASPDGGQQTTKTDATFTTADGRLIADKVALSTCDKCHAVINREAARTCTICLRLLCGRCIRRVIRDHHVIEVCPACRIRTLPRELLRLS